MKKTATAKTNKKMVVSTAVLTTIAVFMTALTCAVDTDWNLPLGWAVLFYGTAYTAMATVVWLSINYN